jgi:hypothetical protein
VENIADNSGQQKAQKAYTTQIGLFIHSIIELQKQQIFYSTEWNVNIELIYVRERGRDLLRSLYYPSIRKTGETRRY